jgi:hypothetical protein
VLLFSSLVFGLAFVFSQLLNFLVQVLLLLSQNLKFRLLAQFNRDFVGEAFVAKIRKLAHHFLAPFDKLFLVILDLSLISFNIGVILQLTAQLPGGLL